MEPIMMIKIKPVDGKDNLANDGDSKYKMEIADLIEKAIELCQEQGGETKMVVEHLQMALKELQDGKMQDDDYTDEMMKSKDSGSFGEMMMKKSEEESNS